jgi:hypothetical protein
MQTAEEKRLAKEAAELEARRQAWANECAAVEKQIEEWITKLDAAYANPLNLQYAEVLSGAKRLGSIKYAQGEAPTAVEKVKQDDLVQSTNRLTGKVHPGDAARGAALEKAMASAKEKYGKKLTDYESALDAMRGSRDSDNMVTAELVDNTVTMMIRDWNKLEELLKRSPRNPGQELFPLLTIVTALKDLEQTARTGDDRARKSSAMDLAGEPPVLELETSPPFTESDLKERIKKLQLPTGERKWIRFRKLLWHLGKDMQSYKEALPGQNDPFWAQAKMEYEAFWNSIDYLVNDLKNP